MEREYKPSYVKIENLQKVCGIYQIRNILNGNIYIGSALNLKRRYNDHFGDLKRKTHQNIHLQNAYNKYGKENFIFEIIEFCNEEEQFIIEQYWLDRFFGKEFCYNMNPFASKPPSSKGKKFPPKSQETIDKSFGKLMCAVVCLESGIVYKSVRNAAHELNIPRETLSKACNGQRKTCGNLHFRYKKDYDKLSKIEIDEIINTTRDYAKTPCVCIDNGQFYNSIVEATKSMGFKSLSCISAVCLGKRKSAGGLRWMYKTDYDKLSEEQKYELMHTKLEIKNCPCVCLETGEVFESISSASKKMNLKTASVNAVCAGRFNSIKGWHFKLKEDYDKLSINEIQEIVNRKPQLKKVLCTTNGKIYDCTKSAAKDLGISSESAISAVCRGDRKHTHGYHFQYIDSK